MVLMQSYSQESTLWEVKAGNKEDEHTTVIDGGSNECLFETHDFDSSFPELE